MHGGLGSCKPALWPISHTTSSLPLLTYRQGLPFVRWCYTRGDKGRRSEAFHPQERTGACISRQINSVLFNDTQVVCVVRHRKRWQRQKHAR